MLSLWQSGAYRLMDDDVPYPSALPTAEGAPTPYKDDEGSVRSEGSGPQSLTRPPPGTGPSGALRTNNPTSKKATAPSPPATHH